MEKRKFICKVSFDNDNIEIEGICVKHTLVDAIFYKNLRKGSNDEVKSITYEQLIEQKYFQPILRTIYGEKTVKTSEVPFF